MNNDLIIKAFLDYKDAKENLEKVKEFLNENPDHSLPSEVLKTARESITLNLDKSNLIKNTFEKNGYKSEDYNTLKSLSQLKKDLDSDTINQIEKFTIKKVTPVYRLKV